MRRTVDAEWGRARALEILERNAAFLRDEVRAGRWPTLYAREIGALADICGAHEVRELAARILRQAPDESFSVGMITNLPRAAFVRRELPSAEAAGFSVYERETVLQYIRRFHAPHLDLALAGKIEEAWQLADTPLDKEECVSTLAVNGNVPAAAALLARSEFPADRWIGPAMVMCVETLRDGDAKRASELFDEIVAQHPSYLTSTLLAAGFLGRVPWGGYPFPDY